MSACQGAGPTSPAGKKTDNSTRENPHPKLLQVENPVPGQEVKLPIYISGKAKGYWYFEGSFPLHLENEHGDVIYETYISADSNWMTKEWVPYSDTLSYKPSAHTRIYLVFRRANASGLPEHDKSYRFPVEITPSPLSE